MSAPAQAETLRQEYERLCDAQAAVESIARRGGEIAPEIRQQYTATAARLREILAVPPDGYTLPRAAADLVAHAAAHGWQTLVQWTPPGWDGEPYVRVQVGRRLTAEEAADHPAGVYLYELTWHSRDCPPGRLRRFGSGLARTPDRPAAHGAPSVRAIRAVIAAHPAPTL
ncbi:hypothetical protein ACFSJS_22680 [Streptomyces desertarenae]|uniref:Uncharacterized protein n=1 Tax=Streptomyces desertarenae TaxID=2666184 RepID=A0ABW4PQA0_9ACTN